MPVITEHARAKVNLTLRVLGRRPDGYHELESLVVFAEASDSISLDPGAPAGVSVHGEFGSLIAGENLIRVTLDRLAIAAPQLRLGHVDLDKRLPVAAGIGGGSADAAAVIRAVRRANAGDLEHIDWMEIAARIGADVPVCLHNGAAIMRGIGGNIEPMTTTPALSAVLVNPLAAVPPDKTARVFQMLSAAPLASQPSTTETPSLATRADLLRYMAATGNDLTGAAIAVVPEIAAIRDALERCEQVEYVALSGGGPTCFAIFPDEASALSAAVAMRAAHPHWWVVATTLSG